MGYYGLGQVIFSDVVLKYIHANHHQLIHNGFIPYLARALCEPPMLHIYPG